MLTNSALWNLRAKAQPAPFPSPSEYPAPHSAHYLQALAMAQQHQRFLPGQMPVDTGVSVGGRAFGDFPSRDMGLPQIDYPAKKNRLKFW
jgi:hypothetical protein